MRSNKTNKQTAAAVLTALALTACANTSNPSATAPIKTVEVPVMPAPPSALLVAPLRPNPPADGTVRSLLNHAAEYGAYVAELEAQNAAWRQWAAPSESQTATTEAAP
ncbi:hypothetical protein [Neisseria perflava]|uniref:hypothetical protein n=1 Tax=Neisseria perflava TaxID=33053 RepID=UPI00209D8289|nr:hypothetical protein [Neisseria perflava]